MNKELGKGLEGGGHDPIMLIVQHLPGRSEEDKETSVGRASVFDEIRTEHLSNSSLKNQRYGNTLGDFWLCNIFMEKRRHLIPRR
jgi:hypothetical protein